MAAFSYAALDTSGREQQGILEADSPRHVRQLLREQGLAPLRVTNAVSHSSSDSGEKSLRRSGASIKVGDLANMTRQLATLLQSGMPLEESLTAISQQSDSSKLKTIVLAVRSMVMEGHSLAHSLAEFPRAFPALYRATVAAGEHAGHLEMVLNRLADYTENAYASRQKAKLALLYPTLLFFMSVAIVSGLMAFVVPDVVEVFSAQGQQLPGLTRGLMQLSDFVVNYGLWCIVLLVLLVMAARNLLRSEELRLRWDRWRLGWPVLGRIIRGNNTARYASTLSILSSSGVPLVDGMSIAAEVVDNAWLQQAVKEAAQQVREGGSLHKALEKNGYFPPIMIHMIASGEASGELDSMLERVAANQQRELDNLVATLIGIFEPMMLLVMGAVVLMIVLAILQPIFNLNQLI